MTNLPKWEIKKKQNCPFSWGIHNILRVSLFLAFVSLPFLFNQVPNCSNSSNACQAGETTWVKRRPLRVVKMLSYPCHAWKNDILWQIIKKCFFFLIKMEKNKKEYTTKIMPIHTPCVCDDVCVGVWECVSMTSIVMIHRQSYI